MRRLLSLIFIMSLLLPQVKADVNITFMEQDGINERTEKARSKC